MIADDHSSNHFGNSCANASRVMRDACLLLEAHTARLTRATRALFVRPLFVMPIDTFLVASTLHNGTSSSEMDRRPLKRMLKVLPLRSHIGFEIASSREAANVISLVGASLLTVL